MNLEGDKRLNLQLGLDFSSVPTGEAGQVGREGIESPSAVSDLKQHWPAIREQLLNGTYEPKPVRRVEIPKPDARGVRRRTGHNAPHAVCVGDDG